MERIFPAKLLLFGEHIVLQGATALALPTATFYGQWAFATTTPDDAAAQGNIALKNVAQKLSPNLPLHLQRLHQDLENGCYFASNIPQGYGLGSSGALCAALYDRYGTGEKPQSPAELKVILGHIESTFHGQSSGIDPLTSLLNQPVLIQKINTVTPLPPAPAPAGITVFLLNTQVPRTTGTLVQWFIAQSQQPHFEQLLHNQILPIHENMVQAWREGQSESFFEHLHHISEWQRLTLHPMLPQQRTLLDWWQEELEQNTTKFKICGAGGGGFLLGFTSDIAAVRAKAQQLQYPIFLPF